MKIYAEYSGIFMHLSIYLSYFGICSDLKILYFHDKKKAKEVS